MRALIDKVFRKSMMERFDLTLKESRRIAVELTRRGVYVAGIDFSQKMINLANSLSKKLMENRCMFFCDDFMRHVFNEEACLRTHFSVLLARNLHCV